MSFPKQNTAVRENLITIKNYLPELDIKLVRKEIFAGLKSEKKFISSKYFYDKKGSELFEKITQLEEYYPTRTELTILQTLASNIAKYLTNITIVELGSGDCSKISVLLNSVKKGQEKTLRYIPVDLSQSAIENSAECLSRKYPLLRINALVADFMQQSDLIPKTENKIICFFGSTLGNLDRDQAHDFMSNISKKMNHGDMFLLGLDMVKNKDILEKAYNDRQQITAAFNKNILNAVNDLTETNFESEPFQHYAFYNAKKQRIEMHLTALKDMTIKSPYLFEELMIKKGESIHTENSHKFSEDHIYELASTAGLNVKKIFSDTDKLFSIVQLIK